MVLAGKKIVTDLLRSEILRVDQCGGWLEMMEEVEGKYSLLMSLMTDVHDMLVGVEEMLVLALLQ